MNNTVRLLRLPLFFLAITGGGMVCAGTGQAVDLTYKPVVGSRWTGTLEVREAKTKGGQVVESTVTREKGEYRFLRKLEKGYQVTYTFNDAKIEGSSPLITLITPLITSLKGQTFTIETNEEGVPLRVTDVARLKAIAVKTLDLVAQGQPDTAAVQQSKQILAGLRAQYSAMTPETGVQLFFDKMLHYTLLQGLPDIPVGEERVYDGQVINPMSGTVMGTKGSFKIASFDKSAGTATIEWQQVVSPEDLKKSALETVKRIVPNAVQGSKEFTDALAQVKIDLQDKATYKVAAADGVVRFMEKTTVVKTQAGEKKTVVTMTMQPTK